jgi:hypothetical protein
MRRGSGGRVRDLRLNIEHRNIEHRNIEHRNIEGEEAYQAGGVGR